MSPLQPGEVASANGALSMILPDTVHTLGLYVDVTVRGWSSNGAPVRCFRAIRSPSYSLDGAPPLDPTTKESCNVLQSSDSSWTLFVSQNLAPGRHTLAVSANGDNVFKAFQVVRDTSHYSLLALPALGGASSGADINQDGVVVGWAKDAAGIPHAVTWTAGVLQRLPETDSSRAVGLSDRAGIVGVMQDPRLARACLRAVIWEKGAEPRLLRAYPSGQTPDTAFVCADDRYQEGYCGAAPCPANAQFPVDVNNNGTVLLRGYLDVGGGVTKVQGGLPFRWTLNNRDQAVVALSDAVSLGYHDGLLGINVGVGETYRFGGECPRSYTSVAGLTDHALMLGNYNGANYYPTGCGNRAFQVDSAGRVTDLSRITGDLYAVALNNLGDMILSGGGVFVLKSGRLEVIALSEPGWTNVGVIKINDAGVILGSATDASGVNRAVLLSPAR